MASSFVGKPARMKKTLFLLAVLLSAKVAYGDEIPTGRFSNTYVETLNDGSFVVSAQKRNSTAPRMAPLLASDIIEFIENVPGGTLVCEGYEPYATLAISRDKIRIDGPDGPFDYTADFAFSKVIGYQSSLTFTMPSHSVFGSLVIGSPVFADENICAYGLEDDDGYLSYLSTIYQHNQKSYAGCCHLTVSPN